VTCPGLHCPGCGHGGGLAVLGTIGAAAAAVVAAVEFIESVLWAIAAVMFTAVPVIIVAAVLTARRMNRPVYRPQPAAAIPTAAGPSRRELEDRLQRAEINASAAMLAVSILAQQPRPLPLSVSYSDTERAIPR
jgi:hypothetical protein